MQSLYPPGRHTDQKLLLTHLNQHHALALSHRKPAYHAKLPAHVMPHSAQAAQEPRKPDDGGDDDTKAENHPHQAGDIDASRCLGGGHGLSIKTEGRQKDGGEHP